MKKFLIVTGFIIGIVLLMVLYSSGFIVDKRQGMVVGVFVGVLASFMSVYIGQEML